ncbi:MAG: IS982 family transposase [Desulfamplus sp.]|nr:IS982 family transposase [Desulfamplus sp.]
MDWRELLITIFVYVCQKYKEELQFYCKRMSNNHKEPSFIDEEAITLYLFGIIQGHSKIKKIHKYAQDHLLDWFPALPSYVAFVYRLNRLNNVFPLFIQHILNDFPHNEVLQNIRLIDSMPIIMATAKRSSRAKVAVEIANKGYCSSKNMYYHGVKLHVMALKREQQLPIPEYALISSASEHDLNVFRQITQEIYGVQIFADKAYINEAEQELLAQNHQIHLLTPVKKKKNQEQLFLFDQLLSTSVSKVRQPIESLFNWIQEKTNIQAASKVRAYNGLMVHVFGKLAAAMILLLMNP